MTYGPASLNHRTAMFPVTGPLKTLLDQGLRVMWTTKRTKIRQVFRERAKPSQSIKFLGFNRVARSAVKLLLGGFTALTPKSPCTWGIGKKPQNRKWRERRGSNP